MEKEVALSEWRKVKGSLRPQYEVWLRENNEWNPVYCSRDFKASEFCFNRHVIDNSYVCAIFYDVFFNNIVDMYTP